MSFAGLRGKGLVKLFECGRPRALSKCLSTVCSEQFRISSLKNRLGTNVKKNVPLYNYNLSYGYYSTLPPHTVVLLPALSPTMEMGTIVSWAKKEGEKLLDGDLLAEIETDKATMGFETPEEGYLAKILVPAGTKDVLVGKPVCVICNEQKDIPSFANFKDEGSSSLPKRPVSPTPSKPSTPPQPPAPAPIHPTAAKAPVKVQALTEKGRVYASPMAKNLAAKKNLRLEDVSKRSGIFGSVKVTDLQTVREKPVHITTSASYTDLPVSKMRAAIAKALLNSKQTTPHFYTSIECIMDETIALRVKFNSILEKQKHRLTINDFIVKACALATKRVPETNATWMDTVIRRYNSVDVSIAVSIDSGLITPIVFEADKKGLIDISDNIKILTKKAREGTLMPHEFQGGTITVSNMGMFGVLDCFPIINPPHACILGVGASRERFISVKGVGVAKQIMVVTMAADHRVLDGAAAAKWLRSFKEIIEDPHQMIL